MHSAMRAASVVAGVEVVSIQSDRSFSRHSHDEFGLGYVVSGGQDSWSGRGWIEAQTGDLITVNPAEMHDGIGRKGTPRYWRMLFVQPDAVTRLADAPAQRLAFETPVLADTIIQRRVAWAIEGAADALSDPADIEERLMWALRDMLRTGPKGEVADGPPCSAGITRIVERIHAEWALPLCLSDFAETAGLSRFQALRHFSREMGTTPHAYLTQHRVKLAKRAIRQGTALADAAVDAGFSDQSHMTRAFQRQYGLSPGRLSPRKTA